MKKNVKLLYDLENIPDKYIEKALDTPVIKARIQWKKIALLAACAAIAISLPFIINSSNMHLTKENITNESKGDNSVLSNSQAEPKFYINDETPDSKNEHLIKYSKMTAEEITASLTPEQKAYQMIEPELSELDSYNMLLKDYGGVAAEYNNLNNYLYKTALDEYQKSAVGSEAGIPFLFGVNSAGNVNYCHESVIFPHNIGLGAANDTQLVYKAGLAAADEGSMCHILWNYSPCISYSDIPGWKSIYECYGSDPETVRSLGSAYTKGLTDGGAVACPKIYFGDNESGRSNSADIFSTEELFDLDMISIFQSQIDAGVKSIMISLDSSRSKKADRITGFISYIKEKMGFEGFVVSDWDTARSLNGPTYREQIINTVNSGVDMMMLTEKYDEAATIIADAVRSGRIEQQRVDDAVRRIIQVKLDCGLFEDPFLENRENNQSAPGSAEYREIAEKLVEESLVLLKNDNNTLPVKKGMSVYITGPACDNAPVQCGASAGSYSGFNGNDFAGVTTILQGFEKRAEEYGIKIITDKNEAQNADVVILAVGESTGSSTYDPTQYGSSAQKENYEEIENARALGKPVIACIVAGRNLFLEEEDLNSWDSVVMCYLPGSEGQGIADVLCGKENFKGTLSSPWYSSADQIGTGNCRFKKGYGLKY